MRMTPPQPLLSFSGASTVPARSARSADEAGVPGARSACRPAIGGSQPSSVVAVPARAALSLGREPARVGVIDDLGGWQIPFRFPRMYARMSPSAVNNVICVSSVIAPRDDRRRSRSRSRPLARSAADPPDRVELDRRAERVADRTADQTAADPHVRRYRGAGGRSRNGGVCQGDPVARRGGRGGRARTPAGAPSSSPLRRSPHRRPARADRASECPAGLGGLADHRGRAPVPAPDPASRAATISV